MTDNRQGQLVNNPDLQFLATLESIVVDRFENPVQDSYTTSLIALGTGRIAQKVGEEAVELALAAVSDSRDEVLSEAADLVYHLLVLLRSRDLSLAELVAALQARHTG